jgi:hypothetical protein
VLEAQLGSDTSSLWIFQGVKADIKTVEAKIRKTLCRDALSF